MLCSWEIFDLKSGTVLGLVDIIKAFAPKEFLTGRMMTEPVKSSVLDRSKKLHWGLQFQLLLSGLL
jgi:hypothetical protein